MKRLLPQTIPDANLTDAIARNVPIILILDGISAFSPAIRLFSKALAVIAVISGFPLGVMSLVGTFHPLVTVDWYTRLILAVIGIMLTLRPFKGARWASLFAVVSAALAAYYVWSLLGVTFQLILAAVFAVVLLATYLLLKLLEDLVQTLGSILSFPLLSVPLGILAIISGAYLLTGQSIAQLFEAISVM